MSKEECYAALDVIENKLIEYRNNSGKNPKKITVSLYLSNAIKHYCSAYGDEGKYFKNNGVPFKIYVDEQSLGKTAEVTIDE